MFKRRSFNYFLAAFTVTILIACVGFYVIKVWPFGDNMAMIADAVHQYLPFFTELKRKLSGGGSLLYSMSGGFGYDFWTTFAYYLSSPWNLLLVFVPVERVCDFMGVLILIKMGLCSGMLSMYLHKRNPRAAYLPIAFGCAYGLSAYVVGYYFNLMWLDSVAVFPMVMYGIERITQGRRGWVYGVSLAYGIWCNYYIGFMLCVFSCLYFLVQTVSFGRAAWYKIRTFILYSLLAGGVCAVLLMPAYAGLGMTEASESDLGGLPGLAENFYDSFVGIMERHLPGTTPINLSETQRGLNVYCGTFAILGIFLYLFNDKITKRERILMTALAGLLLLSFVCPVLNYMWHGFHRQNGIPNRFAFIYVCLVLTMAFDGISGVRERNILRVIVPMSLCAVFIGILLYFGDVKDNAVEALILLFFYSFFLLMAKYVTFKFFSCLAWTLILVEIGYHLCCGMISNGSYGKNSLLSDMRSYESMMSMYAKEGFCRSEVDRQYMRNISICAGANSVVMFNSTMKSSVTDFCSSMGMEARTNKNGYYGVTSLMNDVFGIRYVASPERNGQLYGMKEVAAYGPLSLYENPTALSLGFMVDDSILEWSPSTTKNPLENQNDFVQLATGEKPLYQLGYVVNLLNEKKENIPIPDGMQTYLCIDDDVESIKIETPEYSREIKDYNAFIYPINRIGDSADASVTALTGNGRQFIRAEVYYCDNDSYQETVEKLAKEQMQNVSFRNNGITGNIKVEEDGMLFMTVPYDEGWSVKVDGERMDTYCIGDVFTGIRMLPGIHHVEMDYTPKGFWVGSAISVMSLIIFFIFQTRRFQYATDQRHSRRKRRRCARTYPQY